jgi:cell division control protein 24
MTPVNVNPEGSYRNTAPAMGRNGHPSGNPYLNNGRAPVRPTLPPGAIQTANQTMRMRSASSPDINPHQQARKVPIPSHVAKQMIPPNRSHNNSPNMIIPIRTMTPQGYEQSGHRPTLPNGYYSYEPSSIKSHTTGYSISTDRTLSPPISTPSSEPETFMPSQLRAKVRFEDNYVSMIIPSNIQFRSLTERIDAKLGRFTHHSIRSGSVKLRYQDEEGDLVWIDSDEAVQDALLDWREQHADKVIQGAHGELLLFAHLSHGDHGTRGG